MIIIRNNIIPFPGYSAMTLWPFIFVRRTARYTDTIDRHERIHGRQQVEMLITGAVIAAVLAVAGCGWWSLLALPLFFWLYLAEWLIRLAITGSSNYAYRHISFEQEAYGNEGDPDYLARRKPFAWLRYLLEG